MQENGEIAVNAASREGRSPRRPEGKTDNERGKSVDERVTGGV